MKTERLADVDKNVTKRAKKAAPKKPKKHFFKEVVAELRKVTWPTQKDVIKATGVVVAVVVVLAIFVGAFDYLFSTLVGWIVG